MAVTCPVVTLVPVRAVPAPTATDVVAVTAPVNVAAPPTLRVPEAVTPAKAEDPTTCRLPPIAACNCTASPPSVAMLAVAVGVVAGVLSVTTSLPPSVDVPATVNAPPAAMVPLAVDTVPVPVAAKPPAEVAV